MVEILPTIPSSSSYLFFFVLTSLPVIPISYIYTHTHTYTHTCIYILFVLLFQVLTSRETWT